MEKMPGTTKGFSTFREIINILIKLGFFQKLIYNPFDPKLSEKIKRPLVETKGHLTIACHMKKFEKS
jgi:hypothetical protein